MNSVGKIDHLHAKESNWTIFSLHIKINSKWIKDLNETPKKIKLLENWRQYSQQYSLKHQSLQDLFWNLPYEQFYFQTPCPVPLRCVSDLYQYHIVLISMGVQCSLKSRSVIPPSIFFLDIALATQGLLCFHTIWRNVSESWGKGNKSKSKQNGQTEKILHNEVSYQQNENSAYRMREVICKWYIK